MSDLKRYYDALGVKPGASLEQINQAYKDLVMVWHPDRIQDADPIKLAEAQEMMKQLNHARDQLRAHRANHSTAQAGDSKPSRRYYYQPYPRPYYSNPPRQSNSANEADHTAAPPRPSYQPPRPPVGDPATYRSTGDRSSIPSHYAASNGANSASHPPSQPAPYQPYAPSPPRPQTPDMSGVDLSGANLAEKDLSGRNLRGANLSKANLGDAFLHRVNLSDANLKGANLFRANLLEANLQNANLQDANLLGSDLSGADLSGADLRGAKMWSGDRLMVKLTGTRLKGTILPDGRVND